MSRCRFFHLRSRIDARGHGVRDAPVELSARVHCDDSTSLSLVNLWDQLAFVLEHISFRSDAEATATLKRLCSVLYPTLQEFELQCNSIDALSPSVDRRASLVTPGSSSTCSKEYNSWGDVDVIAENESAGLYVLNVARDQCIPLHIHRRTQEAEMVLDPFVFCQERQVPVGTVNIWNVQQAHVYAYRPPISAAYAQRGRILCIDSPVFDAADEIPVSSDYSTVLRNGHSWHSHLWKGFDSRNCRDKSQLSDVKPEFEFPGAFEGQMVQFFMADPYRGATNRIANAVLVFAFNSNGDLLMCHNKIRGWEIPGGKIEENESAERAAVRELYEETGAVTNVESLQCLAHYRICEHLKSEHVKLIYACRVARVDPLDATSEIDEVRAIAVEDLDVEQIWKDESKAYSVLLKDNVFPLALRLAQTAYRNGALPEPLRTKRCNTRRKDNI